MQDDVRQCAVRHLVGGDEFAQRCGKSQAPESKCKPRELALREFGGRL
jgi:hypothetical protein